MAIFTPEEIARLVAEKPVVRDAPWGRGRHPATAYYKNTIVPALKRSLHQTVASQLFGPEISCSFFPLMIFPPSAMEAHRLPASAAAQHRSDQGLLFYLAFSAPVFTVGMAHGVAGRATSALDREASDHVGDPALRPALTAVRETLAAHGMRQLNAAELQSPIDPSLEIRSLLGRPPWTEFDALYHAYD
jgi:hypothetical protein